MSRPIGGIPLWGWLAIVLASGVVIGGLAVAGQFEDEEPWSGDTGLYGAHAMCADFTRDRLKAPASADFPEYQDRGVTIRRSGNRFTVDSFVDAQNSFGADIRTSFRCVVTVSGDTWRLIEWTER